MTSIVPLLLAAPILLGVAYYDLRYMRIPNWLSIALLVLFAATAIAFQPDDLFARALVATVVFAIGFLCFCFGLFGGGDVKILAALMLLVPVHSLIVFSYLFSASLIVGVIAILALRRLPQVSGLNWKSLSGSTKFPMGVSISLAGISCPFALLALGLA